MKKIWVKTVEIDIVSGQDLIKSHIPQEETLLGRSFRGYWPLITGVPLEDNLFTPIPDGVEAMEKVYKMTGHDSSKIDGAVPQAWWEHYYKVHGHEPRAVWSYEKAPAFGEPLFLEEVFRQYRHAIFLRVIHLLAGDYALLVADH